MSDIRKPAMAGSWYPDNSDSLRQTIKEFIDSADVEKIDGRILGLIAPHAGYIYSGPVAAYSFKTLMLDKKQYRGNTVILIGFAHRPPNWEGVSIWSKGYWETPLGKIPVDEELSQKILNSDTLIQDKREVHRGEHSLELELPFLQYALDNDFKLVPIAFSHQSADEINAVVKAILSADIDWNHTFIVVSTDMSHYHPYNDAVMIDRKSLGRVLSNNIEGLIGWMQQGIDAFCGWAGVVTMMTVAPKIGANKTILLKYANSGDTQPASRERGVVGYSAVAFVKSADNSTDTKVNKSDEEIPGTEEYSLTKDEKLYLLKLSRETIDKYVKDSLKYEPEKPTDNKLVENAPVFVTLHSDGMLRGCIGQMMARGPLYLAVRDMSIAAATQDPRFHPVTADELNKIDIEVSVLSPLKKIDSFEKIRPHKDGVYIKNGWQSGVFLPQVWEQIPKRDDFLRELCTQKAGLKSDCYKDPNTEIYIYTVLEFSEKEMGIK
ncbi:AmmeMemoRadiSam system protein B [bacterium]|nr:AmmeMemoRadiSam system protein B [bacterium]